MSGSVSLFSDRQADIERRLAEALQQPGDMPEQPSVAAVTIDSEELSSQDLLQMAWDKAEQELEQLKTALRSLRQRYEVEEKALMHKIYEKKRLQKALLERAPKAAEG